MKQNFRHKVVAITGAAGGIGRALASCFAQAGSRLALLDTDQTQLAALSHHIEGTGVEVLAEVCDITNETEVSAAITAIEDRFGGIDVLINNAGIKHHSSFLETSNNVLRKVMEVNYFGTLNITRAALPSLILRQGSIVTLSSIAGFVPRAQHAGYSASKHALHGFFDSLRAELNHHRVSITMVCPGRTATNLHSNAIGARQQDQNILAKQRTRYANPKDVAEAIFAAACGKKHLLILPDVGPWAKFWAKYFPNWYQRFNNTSPLRSHVLSSNSGSV